MMPMSVTTKSSICLVCICLVDSWLVSCGTSVRVRRKRARLDARCGRGRGRGGSGTRRGHLGHAEGEHAHVDRLVLVESDLWLHAFDVDAASCCVLRVEPWATSSERLVVSSSIACSVDSEGAEVGPDGTGASRTARLDGDDSGCDSLEPSPDGDPPVCMRGVRGGEELGRPPAGAGVPGGLANMSPST